MTAPTPADVPGQGEVALSEAERAMGMPGGGSGLSTVYTKQVVERILAARLAERDAEVARRAKAEALFGFTQWVASNRAYNGSEHRHGQSLYNECLNGALHVWASDYLRTEPRP